MLRKKRRMPDPVKLNLTPMMDAIFIFIYFLIFSSDFVKMFEIETDTPLVREVPQDKTPETPPLNLVIKVNANDVHVTTGIDRATLIQLDKSDPEIEIKLKNSLLKLRQKYPDDDYATISPNQNISYEEIVKYIDIIQKLPIGMKMLKLPKAKTNKFVSKIYSQIVLEPLKDEI